MPAVPVEGLKTKREGVALSIALAEPEGRSCCPRSQAMGSVFRSARASHRPLCGEAEVRST